MHDVVAGQGSDSRSAPSEVVLPQLKLTPLWTCFGGRVHRGAGRVGYTWIMWASLTSTTRIVACCAAVLALAGCSAGQITQTDHQVAAVDGASGNAGTVIALRNVLLPYPQNQQGTYPAGSAVPVLLTIINQGSTTDDLLAVRSPAASQVLVLGTTQIPAGTTVTSTAGSAGSTSPLVAGELRVVLTTTQPLHAGLNTPVTFQFRNAGQVTLPVPLAPPPN
jgi:periplasmic copper chaperone A